MAFVQKVPEYYKKAMSWLDDNFPFFMTNVVNIGRPVVSNDIDTAAIQWEAVGKEKDFKLLMNDEFCSSLPEDELAGVLSHEAMHVLLRHPYDFRDERYESRQALIVAQECCVNDRLVRMGFNMPEGLFFGVEALDTDCADLTTWEAYEIAVKLYPPSDDEESISDPFGGLSDEQLEDLFNKIIGDAIENGTIQHISEDLLDDILDSLGDDLDSDESGIKGVILKDIGKRAGTGFETVESMAARLDTSIAWVKLLERVNPEILRHPGRIGTNPIDNWARPRRALTSMYPRVLLPSSSPGREKNVRESDGAKPYLVLALDFSGSISREYLDIMTSLAAVVPNDIEVECCTFSTRYVPYDIKSEVNETASGGTDFSAVEDFVRTVEAERGRYPSAVVVITDGEAQFLTSRPSAEQEENNWLWLLLDSVSLRNFRTPGGTYPYSVNRATTVSTQYDNMELLDDYLN